MVTARRSPAPTARSAPTKAATTSSGYHGAVGRAKMVEEEVRSAARREAQQQSLNMPFRFFCPIGETREVVIVDEEPSFFRYEHNGKDQRTGKWSVFCACINEHANCPVCKVFERPSYFAMYLTVIDLTPYDSEKHGTIEWSKKLMVVKSAQQKKITRLWERHKSLRGMVLSMTRDGEKDASIGNDIEFVEFLDEDTLLSYETVYEYEKDGKKISKDILGYEVFDYDELFPMPTEQQLRALVGGKPESGSREEGDSTVGRRGRPTQGEWSDREAPAARTRSARPIRDTVDEDEEEEAPVKTREAPTRRGAAPAKAPKAWEEDSEDAEEVEEAPPARSARPTPGAKQPPPRAQPARRAAPVDDEEDVPQRGSAATSLADRRRALRR